MAKLPFVPLSYIQGLSHRNLLGEDYTDCSFIFLYILCTMSIRQVVSIPCSVFRTISDVFFLINNFFYTTHIVLSVSAPEHSEDARSGALQSCYQTSWRLLGTSSSGSKVLLTSDGTFLRSPMLLCEAASAKLEQKSVFAAPLNLLMDLYDMLYLT